MQKYFSLLKNKKYLLLILLFFVVLVLTIPKTTVAVNGGPAMENLTEKMQSAADVIAGKTTAPKSDIDNQEDCKDGGLAWYWRPVTGLASLTVWFPKKIAQLTGYILSEVMTKVNSWSITSAGAGAGAGASAAFASGWKTTRDLANMLIALGFVIVGIATAIRIREYEAKKALWPLIIVALFVNFSGLFCGLIIDGSNLTMNAMVGANNSTIGTIMVDSARLSVATAICKADIAKSIGGYFGASAMGFFIFTVIALSFLYLTIMLIARYAILGILFVLSPLAFVFWAFPFPKAKDLFNRWWGSFLKWAFAGVGMCYFLMIANGMLGGFLKNPSLSGENADQNAVSFYFLVVLITIVVGVFISIKGSGMIGGAVMGIAGGAVGYAMGKAGVGAKFLSDKTGLSRAGNWAKDRATAAGQAMGLVKPGALQKSQNSRIHDKDRESRINSMSAEQMASELEHPRTGYNARMDRALITEKLGKDKKLGLVSDGRRNIAIAESINAGGNSKDLISGLQPGQIADILNNPAAHPEFSGDARNSGLKTLIESNQLHRINAGQRPRVIGEAGRYGTSIGDLAKSDYHYRGHDIGDNGRAAPIGSLNSDGTTNANAIGYDAAIQEQLRANIPSMSGGQRRQIDQIHMQPDVIMSSFNADTLQDFRTSTQAFRGHVFGTGGALNTPLDTALQQARTAAAGNQNKLNKLQEMETELRRLAT